MSDNLLTDTLFSSFGLHPNLSSGLEKAGFSRCTQIQALVLPVALSGGDITGQAQTGTGKTLTFLTAVINHLLTRPPLAEHRPGDPRALILAPTRELAIQIHRDANEFADKLGLRFALIYGGVDYDRQRKFLQAGVDVIIATPGRLIDYITQHQVVSLRACEVCVLDEADRMFDLGFIKDIRRLFRWMPHRTVRQTLLFSATLSNRVLELAYEHMNNPVQFTVGEDSVTNTGVEQVVYLPSDDEKLDLLLGLLSRMECVRTMIFVNTKVWVLRVAQALENAGYRVGALSGDVAQKKRESLLRKFQAGTIELLVATDIAARGLHIEGVSHVFNYDLPFNAEDYVHRIGRTARFGATGKAISFACERYAQSLPDIEVYINQKIPVVAVTKTLLTAVQRKSEVKKSSTDEDRTGRQSSSSEKRHHRNNEHRKRQHVSHKSSSATSTQTGTQLARDDKQHTVTRKHKSEPLDGSRTHGQSRRARSDDKKNRDSVASTSAVKNRKVANFPTHHLNTRKDNQLSSRQGDGKVESLNAAQCSKQNTSLFGRIKRKLRRLLSEHPHE